MQEEEGCVRRKETENKGKRERERENIQKGSTLRTKLYGT